MKKLLGIVVLGLLLCNNSFAATKGKGEVKVSDRTVRHFKDYLSGKIVKGTRWKPSVFILSSDGEWSFYFYCPWQECSDRSHQGKIKDCERETNVHCGVFSRKRTVIWDNGNDFPTREKRFNSKWDLSKIKSQLEKLGFYDGGITKTKKIEKKKVEKKKKPKKKMNDDLVQQLKDLNELYESGVLTEEEFNKAKKKLLN
tara:strand:- start:39 stop:635 length:597 start_codon:yes stop_codon:yes gene_type:complete